MLAAAITTCGDALAEETAESRARELFSQGLDLEERGDPSGACRLFRESLELVRERGPLRRVKDCDVREGKLISARARVRELIERAPADDPQRATLSEELAALEARIAHLTLTSSGKPPSRLEIDGAPTPWPVTDLEIDPGSHELSAESEGRVRRSEVVLGDGERKSVELSVAPAVGQRPDPPPIERPVEARLTGLGIGGIVVGAAGVLGFAGAIVTGVMALDTRAELDACATTSTDCTTVATKGDRLLVANGILWGIGIVGAGLGTVLLAVDLTRGRPKQPPSAAPSTAPSARVEVRGAGADLRVVF